MARVIALALLVAVFMAGCDRGEDVPYDRPVGNCIEMADLLKNRPYPPKHGVHSHAREVPICGL